MKLLLFLLFLMIVGLEEATQMFRSSGFPDGVSVPTLRGWLKDAPASVVIRAGGHGVAYEIDFEALVAWRGEIERAEVADAAKREQAKNQLALELTGGSSSAVVGLTAKDRKAIFEAELTSNKVRRERHELCEADGVAKAWSSRMRVISQFLTSLPEQLARDLGWSATETAVCAEKIEGFQERMARSLMSETVPDDVFAA